MGLITLGEVLAVMAPDANGRLRHTSTLRLDVAGAECTVAIGVRRLGHPVRYVGRVGTDGLAERILDVLRAENVDITNVLLDPDAPTGLLLKEHLWPGLSRVRYYRDRSAASRLSPADLHPGLFEDTDLLHVTGITAAISPTARETVYKAITWAREAGLTVSFDVNFRSALWSAQEAAEHLPPLAEQADIVFASEDELDFIGHARPAELVVTRGAAGASVTTADGAVSLPAHKVTPVDTVGAGDSLVAGYLSGLLDALPPADRLARGITLAAFTVLSPSDWQGLPSRHELDLLALPDGSTLR